MKMIGEGAPQPFVISRSKGRGNRARIPGAFDGLEAVDSRWKQAPGVAGGYFKIRNEENKMKLGRYGKRLPVQSADDIEATVTGGRGIIGMAFQFRADFEKVAAFERTAGQLVQAIKDSEPDRHAASEAAGLRNFAGDGAGEGKRPEARAFKEMVGRRTPHWAGSRPSPARDGHVVIKTKGNPEAIKARAKVRCARRNADGDLMHGWGEDGETRGIVNLTGSPARDGQKWGDARMDYGYPRC